MRTRRERQNSMGWVPTCHGQERKTRRRWMRKGKEWMRNEKKFTHSNIEMWKKESTWNEFHLMWAAIHPMYILFLESTWYSSACTLHSHLNAFTLMGIISPSFYSIPNLILDFGLNMIHTHPYSCSEIGIKKYYI